MPLSNVLISLRSNDRVAYGEAVLLFLLSSYKQFCNQICLLRLHKQQYHQLSRQHAQEHG